MFKTLADFLPLAELHVNDFVARVRYPVLLVGDAPAPSEREGTHTLTLNPDADELVNQVVIPFHSRSGAELKELVLGRGSSVDVIVPFETVSRRHARVTWDEAGQLTITDEDSKNGTFVNGKELAPNTPAPLNDGDQVKLGDVGGVFLMPPSFHQRLRETQKPRSSARPD
jgi:hypothetical protein